MGKDKEKQKSFRSRQQPASSSQAAALVSGKPEFIGFSTFSPIIDLEQNLPGEYSLCFKKMNKKDTITKVKALNEFIQLLIASPLTETDDQKILLQNWVSSYTKLATDSARQVREAAQQAMGKVATVVKKQLGPHLKSLLPYWLAARFDPSREVARAATESLSQAIPAHKHTEALKFVGKDILQQCRESFSTNPQSFSDAKTPPELAQERYERVISSFMMAVGYLQETLPAEDNVAFAEQYKAIFMDPGFWKFLTNKSPTIRRSTYNLVPVVGRLAKQVPDMDVVSLLAKDILGLFQEKDPSTHQAMWDAILSFTTSFPQSWTSGVVDVRKHVFPRLFAFLRAGTFGSLTFPSLLPFLSVLPHSLRNANFYSQFFGNFWQGYASDGVTKQGRTATQIFMQGYLDTINNAGLTDEEKAETETYLYQEGLWLVLHHYLSVEVLLYGDEFFVENFCKYTTKLFSASTAAEGPNKFWNKFIQVSDSLLTESPAISSPRFISLLQGLTKSSIQVPEGIQRDIFARVVNQKDNEATLSLASSFISIWSIASLVGDSNSFWNTQLLPWVSEWLQSKKSSINSLFSLLSVYLSKPENVDYKSQWGSLLNILVSHLGDTYEHLLTVLSKVTQNKKDWKSAQLDNLAVPLLPGGDLQSLLSPSSASRVLLSLINNNVIERETLHKLGEGLTTYLSTKPAAPIWGLDVIKAVLGSKLAIISESGGHAADFSLISDMLVVFLEYVLHAREDFVLSAWQEIGKQLDTEQATQIRIRLLTKLREHVTSQSATRYHPEIGFTPDADTWAQELVICEVAAKEVSTGLPVSSSFGELVRRDEWVAATVPAAHFLLTNYVDTNISPILPTSASLSSSAEDIESFLKLSLFNLAFCRGLGVASICADNTNLWLASQCECVRMIAYADLSDARTMHAWRDAAQRLQDAVDETSCADALVAHADEVLERSVALAKEVGPIYEFVLEKVVEKVANTWDSEKGLIVLVQYILPLEKEILEKDEALGRLQAIVPHLLPHVAHPLPAFVDLRNKLIQALIESTDFKRTTRVLEALSSVITREFTLTMPEMILILSFFSRFSRAPLKCNDSEFASKRLDIALCKVLTSIVRTPDFFDVSSENWKLLKMKTIDWIKTPSSDPVSVLQRYQAVKLFAELDVVFSTPANSNSEQTAETEKLPENEQVKELDWPSARREAQEAVLLQLVNARNAPNTQGMSRLFSLTAHVFNSLPASLVEPHLTKLYSLFYHENTDVQKWAHHHLATAVSTPIPETVIPAIIPEHEQILRDTTVWEHIFEDDDPPVVRLDNNKSLSVSRVFGHLLAWDILVQFLSSNSTQVRSQISSSFLREGNPSPITALLQNVFKYIHIYSGKGKDQSYPPSVVHFHVADQVSINGKVIGVMSGKLFQRLLQSVPGVVRLWWTDDCEKKMSPFVDSYTTYQASPVIIEKELTLVNKHGSKPLDDFYIYTISRTREVVATYRKDDDVIFDGEKEMVVEIALTLPPNYPLRACSVAINQHLNVGEALWRKWLLGMTTLLLTSEGDLLDACILWRNSLDQHFEGVEVCPICYSLFNAGQLPKLQCRTCKNKFHASCMYKWFSTSHKSTCPLCQTDFQSL